MTVEEMEKELIAIMKKYSPKIESAYVIQDMNSLQITLGGNICPICVKDKLKTIIKKNNLKHMCGQ